MLVQSPKDEHWAGQSALKLGAVIAIIKYSDDDFHPTHHYAQRVASTVDLPTSTARCFSSEELAVLGAIRDSANTSRHGACSLTVNEIAQLVEVSPRVAARAITVAIAAGIIEREGSSFVNHHVKYKSG